MVFGHHEEYQPQEPPHRRIADLNNLPRRGRSCPGRWDSGDCSRWSTWITRRSRWWGAGGGGRAQIDPNTGLPILGAGGLPGGVPGAGLGGLPIGGIGGGGFGNL